MRSDRAQDHTHLARLARSRDAELRPLLLRVQTQTFAEAIERDPAMLASYQAIALGLIPLVPDDVLAETASILRNVHDTPLAVTAALARRLARDRPGSEAHHSVARSRLTSTSGPFHPAKADQAEAGADAQTPVSPGEPAPTPEVGLLSRAAEYRRLDAQGRTALREDLGPAIHDARLAPSTPDAALVAVARDAAFAGDVAQVRSLLAGHLGASRDADLDLRTPVGQEFYVFALLSLGLDPDGCIRAILSAEGGPSRSVEDVFRLAQIARSTPVAVATLLLRHGPAAAMPRVERTGERRPAFAAASGQLRADGRADPISPVRAMRPTPMSERTVPFGRRSRATTGPDRT